MPSGCRFSDMRAAQRLLSVSAAAAAGAVRPEIRAASGFAARTMGSRAKEELVPCAPSPELAGQISDASLLRTQCYVGGQWIEASDGGKLEVRTAAACPAPAATVAATAACSRNAWPASGPHCCSPPQTLPTPWQVLNPATGKAIATVPRCGANETRAAIAEAATQFETWGRRPGKERAAILKRCAPLLGRPVCCVASSSASQSLPFGVFCCRTAFTAATRTTPPHLTALHCRWYQEVLGAREDITRLMTLESGKPLAESRSEFDNGCGQTRALLRWRRACWCQSASASAGASGGHAACVASRASRACVRGIPGGQPRCHCCHRLPQGGQHRVVCGGGQAHLRRCAGVTRPHPTLHGGWVGGCFALDFGALI